MKWHGIEHFITLCCMECGKSLKTNSLFICSWFVSQNFQLLRLCFTRWQSLMINKSYLNEETRSVHGLGNCLQGTKEERQFLGWNLKLKLSSLCNYLFFDLLNDDFDNSDLSVAPATVKVLISSIVSVTALLEILISQKLKFGAYCVCECV